MSTNGSTELMLLDQVSQALAEVRDLDQIKVIRDKAEAVRKYAQSASLGLEIQNRAAEVKLRAERQAGKLLSQLSLRGGDRRSKDQSDRLKLDDLGISPNQSTRWQKQAKVSEKVFRRFVSETCATGRELTGAGLMRIAREIGKPSRSTKDRRRRPKGQNENEPVVSPSDSPPTELDAMAGDLKDHLSVLDGILRPLYTGSREPLRASEQRFLKYLMAEIRQLTEHISRQATRNRQ